MKNSLSSYSAHNISMSKTNANYKEKVGVSTELSKKSILKIGVLSAKGGNGATTLALNLALSLAKSEARTILIDANLQQPDLAIVLGKEPEHSIVKLLSRINELSYDLLSACSLSLYGSNKNERGQCLFLSGPARGEAAFQVNLSQIASALPALSQYTDYLILDLPRNLDKHLVTVLDSLDVIVLVFEPTLQSVTACKRWLNSFDELSYKQEKCIAVLNRAGAKSIGLGDELVKTFQQTSSELMSQDEIINIPNAFFLNQECQYSGKIAVIDKPREKYSLAVEKLSKKISLMSVNSNSVKRLEGHE